MHRILIIGATGNVGRQVVAQLRRTGVQVRALVRNPQTAGLPPHVEVVRGDLTLPETLDACLDGIDAVFLVWFAPPNAVAPALERILKHTQRVVFLSSPHKHPHPFFQGGQPNPVAPVHAEIERLIETSGRQWTFLRPGMFAANALSRWAPQIRAGDVVRWPHLAAPTAPIHERDIAAVAVRALSEDGHNRTECLITGPQSMTQQEQISTIASVLGRSLRIEEMPPNEFLSILPPLAAKMLLGAWSAAIGQPALVTTTVADITGSPARTLREWTTDHATEFQRAVAYP